MPVMPDQSSVLDTRSAAEHMRERFAKCKPNLPLNHKQILYKHYPEYDSAQGLQMYYNVMCGRSSNVKLIEILERIANRELTL